MMEWDKRASLALTVRNLPSENDEIRTDHEIVNEDLTHMARQRNRWLWLLGFVFICLMGCDHPVEANESISLPGYWESEREIEFTIPELATDKAYDLFIELRNTNDYPFSNLFLIASLEYPNGKVVTDTLEYRMTRPDGSWLGTGMGNVKANRLWYKEGMMFEEQGEYQLKLSQAMRQNGQVEGVAQLIGITDVGYSIEAVQQPGE